jgi:hypothetical protein
MASDEQEFRQALDTREAGIRAFLFSTPRNLPRRHSPAATACHSRAPKLADFVRILRQEWAGAGSQGFQMNNGCWHVGAVRATHPPGE